MMIWTQIIILPVSPWYNRTGWLDIKHHVTYLLICLFSVVAVFVVVGFSGTKPLTNIKSYTKK